MNPKQVEQIMTASVQVVMGLATLATLFLSFQEQRGEILNLDDVR